MIKRNPALSPCITKPEVVFSNTADGVRDEDKEDLSELFNDKVSDEQDMGGTAEGPAGVEATLSEGEELEETAVQRILPDRGEPTASQREDHRAGGHITFRSWCEDCGRQGHRRTAQEAERGAPRLRLRFRLPVP